MTLAKQSELKVTGARTPRDCVATLVNHWGFFCDYFDRWWAEQKEFGRDAGERISKLKSGGYRIITTLDVGVQDSAKRNVEAQLPTGNRDALMLTAIEPGTGYVRALAANRAYSLDTSQNQPSSDPGKRALGIKGTFPEHDQPAPVRRWRHRRLQGRVDVQDLHDAHRAGEGLPARLHDRRPVAVPVAGLSGRHRRLGACPDRKHWCPRTPAPGT